MKKALKQLAGALGYELRKKGTIQKALQTDMEGGLLRCLQRGMKPATIIDIGAAQGSWSLKAHKYWPQAKYVMVEPLKERLQDLQHVSKTLGNAVIVNALAGEVPGVTQLSVTDDLDGSGVYGNGNLREVEVTTLDNMLRDHQLKGPFAIKFDTHGYEKNILLGAGEVLKHTELLIIEVYGFYVSPTALLFHELSAFLATKGFRMVDMVDTMYREKDLCFWQADVFYMRSEHAVFKSNSFK